MLCDLNKQKYLRLLFLVFLIFNKYILYNLGLNCVLIQIQVIDKNQNYGYYEILSIYQMCVLNLKGGQNG
jgi:hypothetical protein